MIIDFHTHAYADSIAQRAVGSLTKTANIESFTDGTLGDLRQKLPQCGIDKAVVLPVATKPTQQTTINNWAAENNRGEIIAFGSVHPDADDVEEEVKRIRELGLFGIKLHPAYQRVFLFDRKWAKIFAAADKYELPIILHMGYDPVEGVVRYAMPAHLKDVNECFPNLKLIGAHFGGMMAWEEVRHYLAGRKNIWLDTAYTSADLDKTLMAQIIKLHGADRVLYGSDLPWRNPVDEINHVKALDISQEEKDMIFYKNAMELLKL